MTKPVERLKAKARADAEAKVTAALQPEVLIALLRRRRVTTKALCDYSGGTERQVLDAIHGIQGRGYLLSEFGNQGWGLSKEPAPDYSEPIVYASRPDGTYLFGASSDQHIGSKQFRQDVLDDLYDKFAEVGVDRVFNGGNWIEGEGHQNVHDIAVHGMDDQCWELADKYPKRDGIVTYAIAGADHEGWYSKREGVDIGKHAARIMAEAGRKDWVHLGYVEAYVTLNHAKSGKACHLLVMHPGGGSAYAHSYKPQKIVESFSGGSKPAILLIAHYHKQSYNIIRNVHVVQSGCTQDQTVWARQKGLDVHLGGSIIRAKQDAATGAITECEVRTMVYFDEGYYNGRWSHAGPVVPPIRRRVG